jgi:methylated-DNA-[protein]-cysteine S-methyltransferase
MKLHSTTLTTPVGPFMVVGGDDGIYASGFTTRVEDLQSLMGIAFEGASIQRSNDLGEYSRAANAYFAGDLTALDRIPVIQRGSPYHLAAWAALRAIPAGAPISYRALAARLGNAAAPRAAGTACGRNAIAVIVPCHRVVRSDGGLGGFGWGLEYKRWLLDHEARPLL